MLATHRAALGTRITIPTLTRPNVTSIQLVSIPVTLPPSVTKVSSMWRRTTWWRFTTIPIRMAPTLCRNTAQGRSSWAKMASPSTQQLLIRAVMATATTAAVPTRNLPATWWTSNTTRLCAVSGQLIKWPVLSSGNYWISLYTMSHSYQIYWVCCKQYLSVERNDLYVLPAACRKAKTNIDPSEYWPYIFEAQVLALRHAAVLSPEQVYAKTFKWAFCSFYSAARVQNVNAHSSCLFLQCSFKSTKMVRYHLRLVLITIDCWLPYVPIMNSLKEFFPSECCSAIHLC